MGCPRFSLYPDLSIAENLRYAAGLRGSDAAFKTRSEHFLGLLDLHSSKNAWQVASQGMKQTCLCCADSSTGSIAG